MGSQGQNGLLFLYSTFKAYFFNVTDFDPEPVDSSLSPLRGEGLIISNTCMKLLKKMFAKYKVNFVFLAQNPKRPTKKWQKFETAASLL